MTQGPLNTLSSRTWSRFRITRAHSTAHPGRIFGTMNQRSRDPCHPRQNTWWTMIISSKKSQDQHPWWSWRRMRALLKSAKTLKAKSRSAIDWSSASMSESRSEILFQGRGKWVHSTRSHLVTFTCQVWNLQKWTLSKCLQVVPPWWRSCPSSTLAKWRRKAISTLTPRSQPYGLRKHPSRWMKARWALKREECT